MSRHRMNRRQVLELVCRYRRRRDQVDRSSMFQRGMGAGYHLSAHMLWRELWS